MDSLQNFFNGFSAYIKRFNLTQVLLMVAIFMISVIGIMVVAGVFKTINYGVLYSNLPGEEAGEVTEKLTEMGIDYQLSDGGKTIKVPSDKVYQTRISLASLGMPTGGSAGYSIFDKTNLGMTDFVQKVNFRRALEGELGRTITDLEEVKAARVHIVMPENRLFEEDQKEATASVVLKLSGSGSLSKRQLTGITHLVSSGVEGLKNENITVVDNWGNLLTSVQGADPMVALSATQLEMKKSVESYLEGKAQSLLSSALGHSRAVVRIDAELDFDQVTKSMENYDPDQVAVRSEERQEFNSSDTSSSIGYDTLNSGGKEISERVITNYEVSRSTESIISSVGGIKKLSIAVMVDGSYAEVENENGDIEKQYIPRDDAELQKLSSIVKRAVGFNETRSDQFDIVNIAFDTEGFEEEVISGDFISNNSHYIEIGKKVLLVLAILFGFLYFKKKIGKLIKEIASYSPAPQKAARPAHQEQEDIQIEPQQVKLVDKMKTVAQEKPEEVTKVIKTIMTE